MQLKFPEKSKDSDLHFDAEPHRFWWVRGLVLEVNEVERPSDNDKLKHLRDLHLKIGDVDNPDDGYEVRIEGNWHNIEPNDAISLLGHEVKTQDRVSYPRLFINHCTGDYRRAYPVGARLPFGVLPIVEHKYWLAGALPTDGKGKLRNLWILLLAMTVPFIILGGVTGPLLAFLLFVGVLVLASPIIVLMVLLWLYLRWLLEQPRFSWEDKQLPPLWLYNVQGYIGFRRTDFTARYEKMAVALHRWALQNPAPELDWVPVARGAHTVGYLPPPPEPTREEMMEWMDQMDQVEAEEKAKAEAQAQKDGTGKVGL